jgi:hypothetical protein
MLNRVAIVSTDVSVERVSSIIRVTTIDDQQITLAVTTNLSIFSQRSSVASYH